MSKNFLEHLSAPFDPDRISWRVGSMTKDKKKGMALAYIDARDVQDRLDQVCGQAGWQARYPHAGAKTVCEIGIKIGDEWVWKANGAGDSDIEAEKGALSDAFKRAAVLWGIGRYLYDLDSPWVEVNEWKQIEKHEMAKLRAVAAGVKPKSAYQARKDGGWKKLAEGLQECRSREGVEEYLIQHSAMIREMPAGWRGNWSDLVDRMRGTVEQMADGNA